jgi:hypothetical protein
MTLDMLVVIDMYLDVLARRSRQAATTAKGRAKSTKERTGYGDASACLS